MACLLKAYNLSSWNIGIVRVTFDVFIALEIALSSTYTIKIIVEKVMEIKKFKRRDR